MGTDAESLRPEDHVVARSGADGERWVEIYELSRTLSPLKLIAFALNLAVVIYLRIDASTVTDSDSAVA